MADRNGWKGWALAVVTALLVGSSGFGFFSNNLELEKLEIQHKKDIKEAKRIRDKDYDVIMEMSRVIVRIDANLTTTMELVKELKSDLRSQSR